MTLAQKTDKPAAPAAKTETRQMSFQDPDAEDKLLVTTEKGYLDYDQEHDVIYANERTKVVYKGMTLEADSMHIDVRLREVNASGNVLITGAAADLHADEIRYNLREQAGEVRGASGNVGVLYLQHRKDETAGPASFERLGPGESRITGARFTTCDFKKPMYYISAKEVLLEHNERIFFKGATLYVHDLPVFYFPVYSRGLGQGSPWSVFVGYKSGLGPWARLRYTYQHQTREPDLQNDDQLVTTAQGKLDLFLDYISARGPGLGLDYKYSFGQGRHRGETSLYFLNDSNREIPGDQTYQVSRYTRSPGGTKLKVAGSEENRRYDQETELGRYQADILHRSQLTEHMNWIVNTDWHSDPELYDEVLDLFSQVERRRVMTRQARTALTWTREQAVARIMFDVKDRIGRDRLTNFSDPGDNNRDFDIQPELDKSDREDEAIPTDRWGRTTIRAPQITIATAWLKLWNLPLYYHTDLNLFNSLDKGLNTVDTADDAWVRGADWYHALMWRWRINERLTLSAKLGAGAGIASRDNNDYEYFEGEDRLYPVVLDEPEGGLEFIDPKTFLIGDERFSYQDIASGFFYADAMLRLRARISHALTGDLIYRYRYATQDSLGDWYAQMGNQSVRSDLYDFRMREHNLEGILRYDLAQPRLALGAQTYRNLTSSGELFPNELVSRNGIWGSWSNIAQTLDISGWGGIAERQIYHPTDSRAYIDSSLDISGAIAYRPVSQRWWTKWSLAYEDALDRSLNNDDDKEYFTEDETRLKVRGLLGMRVGPKWKAELGGEYDSLAGSLRRMNVTLNRDFHDVMLMMMLGFKKDSYKDDEKDNGGAMQSLDFRFALQPKLPGGGAIQGMPGITTLQGDQKDLEVSQF